MGLWSDLPAWQLVLVTLGLTHITIAAVTIFLHRTQAHRALDLGAIPSHFFRFWLWLTTGMVTREWVAIHRKHHAKCETADDPHSPKTRGLHTVLWLGAWLYRQESKNQETLEKYGKGTPDDWLERHLYTPYPWLGITLMLTIDLLLFGLPGILVWLVQMVWIPFWAAGVINGLAHFWGYRNWNTTDASTNISPIGILIGGEELHNNHHAFASSARLSNRWYEFDIGWFYIRVLETLHMAKVRKLAPRLRINPNKQVADSDTVSAILGNRLQVLSNFARQVIKPVTKAELRHQVILAESQTIQTVYQFQQRLYQLWERTTISQEARLEAIQEWISAAEQTGISALEKFAHRLRGYSVIH
ncbi:MAG TPA: fatty acid desaturase [Candidatus Thiothrix moscowensis]|uniref:DesA family fatty acid desaturase n=1 Tax=unclassified Thiothrix TaxID=2636184 RepID=UPI0025EF89BC|nr:MULTISPECIES: fatty acid desaturase [unclassified Thiothrix]HRJ53865.1 fatty acid desaturase [Candidatus Thiothrix moscowensis]HRJ93947.1 fatty acid desaturase [Candidatus Thiothrix moscowensis]